MKRIEEEFDEVRVKEKLLKALRSKFKYITLAIQEPQRSFQCIY